MSEPKPAAPPSILLADDESTFRDSLAEVLREEGMEVTTVGDGAEALARLKDGPFDLLISDIQMPGVDGLALLKAAHESNPGLGVILITAYGSVDSAVQAMKLGASDYILKPLLFDDLILKVRRILQYRQLDRENRRLRAEIAQHGPPGTIVGSSNAIREVLALVDRIAQTRSNVLIVGESGTGKELIARAIHNRGITAEQAFIAVNCGGIPETLFESEMFGYRRGAFTGAVRDKVGFFEAANGGTLFLDEVGNLPLAAQMALLRAIEQKAVTRIGDTRPQRFELRIVSATNRDPGELVAEGKFRDDLYFRLNVVQLRLPPLRERPDDIPLLIEHFIRKYNAEMKRACPGIAPEALRILQRHPWKGNIRELENVIERALIFAEDRLIEPGDLPFGGRPAEEPGPGGCAEARVAVAVPAELPEDLGEAVRVIERQHLAEVLARYNYDKNAAARALNISLPSLYRKLHDLGLPLREQAGDS